RSYLNPVTIYCFIWCTVVTLYELKLVNYFELTLKTWIIIFLFQLFYILGCFIAKDLVLKNRVSLNNDKTNIIYDKKMLLKTIYFLTIISSVAILPNLFFTFKRYGLNLLNQTNQLYADRLTGQNSITIPYLTAFIEPALILIGFYFSKYNFKMTLTFPIFLYL